MNRSYYIGVNLERKDSIICVDLTALAKFTGCSDDTLHRQILKNHFPFEYKGTIISMNTITKSRRGK
jgi:hypothetical protein